MEIVVLVFVLMVFAAIMIVLEAPVKDAIVIPVQVQVPVVMLAQVLKTLIMNAVKAQQHQMDVGLITAAVLAIPVVLKHQEMEDVLCVEPAQILI